MSKLFVEAVVLHCAARVVITINDKERVDVSPELAEEFAEAVLRAAEQARDLSGVYKK